MCLCPGHQICSSVSVHQSLCKCLCPGHHICMSEFVYVFKPWSPRSVCQSLCMCLCPGHQFCMSEFVYVCMPWSSDLSEFVYVFMPWSSDLYVRVCVCVYALVIRSVCQSLCMCVCPCHQICMSEFVYVFKPWSPRSVDQRQYVTGCMCVYALVTRSVDQCQYIRVWTVQFGRQVMATVSAYSAEAAATCWGRLLHLHLQQHSW